jgi:hypothetical protein
VGRLEVHCAFPVDLCSSFGGFCQKINHIPVGWHRQLALSRVAQRYEFNRRLSRDAILVVIRALEPKEAAIAAETVAQHPLHASPGSVVVISFSSLDHQQAVTARSIQWHELHANTPQLLVRLVN